MEKGSKEGGLRERGRMQDGGRKQRRRIKGEKKRGKMEKGSKEGGLRKRRRKGG